MKYTHKHFLPPGLVTTPRGTFIVPGWTPVPSTTTLSDITHEPIKVNKPKTYEVIGSKGGKYTVTVRSNRTTCTCPAGKFRGKCKHINEIEKL